MAHSSVIPKTIPRMTVAENKHELSYTPLLETPYRVFSYNAHHRLLLGRWKPTSATLNEKTFREESRKLAELISLYNPLLLLMDQTDFAYPISPDMQHWFIVALADTCTKGDLKRLALVSNTNLLVQISVESIGDIGIKLGYRHLDHRFFNDAQEATRWLINS